eukprot:c29967_g1_i1 orf=2-199(-)
MHFAQVPYSFVHSILAKYTYKLLAAVEVLNLKFRLSLSLSYGHNFHNTHTQRHIMETTKREQSTP